jgi:hypothetical protein
MVVVILAKCRAFSRRLSQHTSQLALMIPSLRTFDFSGDSRAKRRPDRSVQLFVEFLSQRTERGQLLIKVLSVVHAHFCLVDHQ